MSKSFLITKRSEDFYDQIDPDDSLINCKMIEQFVEMNQKSVKPVELETDINVYQSF